MADSWWVKTEGRADFAEKVRQRTAALSPQHGSSRVMGPVAGGRGYETQAREVRRIEREKAQKGREGRKVKQ